LTVSAWAHHEGQSDWNAVIVRYDDCISSYVWGMTLEDDGNGLVCHDHNRFQTNHDIVVNPFTPSGWTHYVFVKDPDNGVNKVYVNGELLETVSFASPFSPSGEGSPQLYVGSCGGWAHGFVGSIDDVAFFDRTLTDDEIENLYNGILPVLGCTNLQACNYNEVANEDDGSCEFVSCHCLDGTVWSEELGGCIPAATCPQDLDFDGVVGVNDLMNLLSAFGTPCEPSVAEWTCGDPVSYHAYDYETVLIGEQCWFAENSRYIPAVSPASDYSMSQPRCHVYGYNGSAVEEAVLTAAYGVYGALYNFQAVQQWEICPTGWHVPSDEDWMGLELTLGIPADSLDVVGYRGCNVGDQLKSESLWNGTNQSGMNMLPGGGTVDSGEFVFLEERGWFWSSTEAPQQAAWFRQLESNQNGIYRAHWNQNQEGGKSIRCIKD